MESLLIKIFATALALSQVTTAPDAVKTQFDRTRDQEQVTQLLRDGCSHIKKVFDIERINLDDLITTALEDTESLAKENKAFRNINFVDLQAAYRQFCTNQAVLKPAIDVGAVIDAYDKAAATLPDDSKLKQLKPPSSSVLLDGKGEPFAEISDRHQRRIWVPLADIPKHVQAAFIAAEDQHFYEHKGVDERGLIRAFISNLANPGRLQGGSTITQQVVKNLLVGDDRTYERKIKEIILTTRVEQTFTKPEILGLYLNAVYFGRGAWGIEIASRNYFGKPAKELTIEEGALLAGLVKGPNYFNPYRHPVRAQERLAYVLKRLRQEQDVPVAFTGRGLPPLPKIIAYQRTRRDIGFYFVDQIARESRRAGIESIKTGAYTVHSTINQNLQRSVEAALQEGLSRYEREHGRAEFKSPEANLTKRIERINAHKADANADDNVTTKGKKGKKNVNNDTKTKPAWQRALSQARFPLYDVHWEPAVIIGQTGGRRGGTWRIGLRDGRVMSLSTRGIAMKGALKLYDVVLVNVSRGGRGRRTYYYASLRARPSVQGQAVVIENKTGRILAMSGGFSYPLSQLNRTIQARRQPGSTIKPLVYLAALDSGLQPNTLVEDEPLALPPIDAPNAPQADYWTPQNDGGSSSGPMTLRNALAYSRNLATVHLLTGGIENKPQDSIERLCSLAVEAKVYKQCDRFYSFVLGSQPVRPINLAAFYAAIANDGLKPTPYVIDSIEQNGQTVYRHEPKLSPIPSVDSASFYQLKTLMQGVLAHGTAAAIANLSPYVAGKTGTTDDENDAWFVGLTNDVTVAVWVGYDNARERRTLGGGSTGGAVAVPIFEPIINAAWTEVAPRTRLLGPSAQARRNLRCRGRRGDSSDCYFINAKGRVVDTQNVLLWGDSRAAKRIRKEARLSRPVVATTDGSGSTALPTPQPRQGVVASDDDNTPPVNHDIQPRYRQTAHGDDSGDNEVSRASRASRKARRSRARRAAHEAREDAKKERSARRSRARQEVRSNRRSKRVSRSRPQREVRRAPVRRAYNDPWSAQWSYPQQQYRQSYSWGQWR